MFLRSSSQGIKQYINIGVTRKTSHSDQARAVPIGATRSEAMNTTTSNKKMSFLYIVFCLLILLLKSSGNLFPD